LLLEPGEARIERFRPPAADAPSARERERLRGRIEGAVGRWRWATELGLRVTGLEAPARPDAGAAVCWRAEAAPLVLMLEAEPAAALVCLSVGAEPPSRPETRLSAVDVAVLDLWARRALAAVGTALDGAVTGEVQRVSVGVRADGDEPMIAATLAWAGERPAGRLLVGPAPARGEREPRAALGDRPGALLGAPVRLGARIDGPELPLAELLTLGKGDVVLLGRKTAVEVALDAGDVTVATGRPGSQGGRMAVRLSWTWEALERAGDMTEAGGEMTDGG